VQKVAAQTIFDENYVRHDYWRAYVLEIASSKFVVYWKGGATLSCCYGITSRLSKDIRIYPKKDKCMQGIQLCEEPNSSDKKAKEDRERWFNTLVQNFSGPFLKDGFKIDRLKNPNDKLFQTCCFSITTPNKFDSITVQIDLILEHMLEEAKMKYRPLISQFLDTNSVFHILTPEIVVAHPVETLLEKLDAITKKHNQREPSEYIRHYYDVYCIITKIDLPPTNATTLFNQKVDNGSITQHLLNPTFHNSAFADTSQMQDAWKLFCQTLVASEGNPHPEFAVVTNSIISWIKTHVL